MNDKNKITVWVLFILGTLLFTYTAIRAYLLSITWDEAFNYLEFTRNGILFSYNAGGMSANNHLLNTWLTYLTTSLFGVSEFSLRIPNLIAHILFLFFTAKISFEFSSRLFVVSAFLVLNLNPYLLDFFSLSRGYGLSYGLLAGSIWYLYLFLKNNLAVKYSILSLLFSMVATLAHLTLIQFVFSLTIVIFIIDYFFSVPKNSIAKKIFSVVKKNYLSTTCLIIFCMIILPLGTGLHKAGALFYGGNKGFWTDTVLTVIDRLLYEKSYPILLKSFLSFSCIILMLLTLVIVIRKIRNKKTRAYQLMLPALLILLCLCSFVSILQHYLFNTLYLTERTALYLLILFSFLFVFLAKDFIESNRKIFFIMPFVAGIVLLHFINCFNLYYVLEWKWDADIKTMIKDIEASRKINSEPKFNLTMGVPLEFEQPVNFYRVTNNLSWLNVATRENTFHPLHDYYFVMEADLKKTNPDSLQLIKTYSYMNNALWKPKYRPLQFDIKLSKKVDYDSAPDSAISFNATSDKYFYSGTKSGLTDKGNEYSGGIAYSINDSLFPAKNSMVTVKAKVFLSNLKETGGYLVISLENKTETYLWKKVNVLDYALQEKKWYDVYFTCIVPESVQIGDVLKVYLWNNREPVYVDEMETRWITAVF